MHSNEAKSLAIARRMLGDSFRQIERYIAETLKEAVPFTTIARWCQDEGIQAVCSRAQVQRMLAQDTEIGVMAGEIIQEEMPNLTMDQRLRLYGINRDKVQGWIKIDQDERKTSSPIESIREQLREKPPHELKALLDAAQDDYALPDTPVI